MGILWNFFGVSMTFYGVSEGASMEFLRDSYGVPKGTFYNISLWNFHGGSMIFLWDFYWAPVGFPWYFYDRRKFRSQTSDNMER